MTSIVTWSLRSKYILFFITQWIINRSRCLIYITNFQLCSNEWISFLFFIFQCKLTGSSQFRGSKASIQEEFFQIFLLLDSSKYSTSQLYSNETDLLPLALNSAIYIYIYRDQRPSTTPIHPPTHYYYHYYCEFGSEITGLVINFLSLSDP